MTCPDCINAQARPWHGYRLDCSGCVARSVARSQAYHDAAAQGRQTREYRQMLQRMDVTHEQVQRAAWDDFQCRRKAA